MSLRLEGDTQSVPKQHELNLSLENERRVEKISRGSRMWAGEQQQMLKEGMHADLLLFTCKGRTHFTHMCLMK